MSKKQREKVEDEVRFHRAQLRAQSDSAPDSSVFEQQTPSSSDQLHHGYNGGGYTSTRDDALANCKIQSLSPRYQTYNDVGSYTPAYYPGQTQVPASTMGYDISADYVDSTTAYDPRPGLDALSDTGSLMTNVVTTGKSLMVK